MFEDDLMMKIFEGKQGDKWIDLNVGHNACMLIR